MRLLKWSSLAFIAALAIPAVPASAATGPPVARTDRGLVRGVTGPGYRQFNGVPYAAPPVGELRRRAPQPVDGWRGVRDATTTRQECAQNSIIKAPEGVEDCLY